MLTEVDLDVDATVERKTTTPTLPDCFALLRCGNLCIIQSTITQTTGAFCETSAL